MLPVQLNLLKHHASAAADFARSCSSAEELRAGLLKIGHSLMDLYHGELSPQQLFEETWTYLETHGVHEFEAYARFLQPEGFRTLQLSDASQWVLRLGHAGEPRYVHLHPGRYSPHSRRVKASGLKTALALLWTIEREGGGPTFDTAALNKIRTEVLELPPVREAGEAVQIARVLELLRRT